MKYKQALAIAALAAGTIGFTPAQAQVTLEITGGNQAVASYFKLGNCLDFNASGVAMHTTCNGSIQQRFVFVSGDYGQIRGSSGFCLTSGLQSGALTLQACANGKNQRWGYQSDGSLRNELGLCIDVEGENRTSGGRVMAFSCTGKLNQKWYQGQAGARARMTAIPSTMLTTTVSGAALISSSGISQNNIVAGGAGNIVAGGAGNIVAGGAGNIVAGGAGNIIAASIVAGGAGNLIANDGASMRALAASSFNASLGAGFRR